MSDSDITAAALAAGAGDRQAAAVFVRATYTDVTRFLTHLTGARDAGDLTQETYLRAWRGLPRFAGHSSARTWLFAIARRVAVDHVRAALTRPRLATLDDWHHAADTATAGTGSRHDEHTALRALVADLAPERREAFVATQVLGLSYAEAADVCDCPVGTIRSRVARAREDLVAALHAERSGTRRRSAG